MSRWQIAAVAAGIVFAWTIMASWSLIALYYAHLEAGFVPVFDIPDNLSWPWVAWWRQIFFGRNDEDMRRLLLVSALVPFLPAALFGIGWYRRRQDVIPGGLYGTSEMANPRKMAAGGITSRKRR